jgi:hypothetical protein
VVAGTELDGGFITRLILGGFVTCVEAVPELDADIDIACREPREGVAGRNLVVVAADIDRVMDIVGTGLEMELDPRHLVETAAVPAEDHRRQRHVGQAGLVAAFVQRRQGGWPGNRHVEIRRHDGHHHARFEVGAEHPDAGPDIGQPRRQRIEAQVETGQFGIVVPRIVLGAARIVVLVEQEPVGALGQH